MEHEGTQGDEMGARTAKSTMGYQPTMDTSDQARMLHERKASPILDRVTTTG